MVSFASPLTISRPQIDDLIHRFTLALVDVLGSSLGVGKQSGTAVSAVIPNRDSQP